MLASVLPLLSDARCCVWPCFERPCFHSTDVLVLRARRGTSGLSIGRTCRSEGERALFSGNRLGVHRSRQ